MKAYVVAVYIAIGLLVTQTAITTSEACGHRGNINIVQVSIVVIGWPVLLLIIAFAPNEHCKKLRDGVK